MYWKTNNYLQFIEQNIAKKNLLLPNDVAMKNYNYKTKTKFKKWINLSIN